RPGAPADADSGPGKSRSAQKAARRARRRNLAAAVLTVSGIVVLPLVVWAALGSGEDTPSVTDNEAAKAPVTGTDTATAGPSWAGDQAQGAMRGRLHNVASGLCIGIVGGKPADNAETELAACSSAPGQQWSYEPDGLLRSAADAGLCLDSRLGYSVRLGPCAGTGQPEPENVRYDFTLQGTLVPRSGQNLALAPAATDGSGALVLKNRVDSAAQRWVIDTSKPDPQMQFVNWGADSTASGTPAPSPKAAKSPAPVPSPTSSAGPAAAPTPTSAPGSPSGSNGASCSPAHPSSCQWGGGHGGYGDGGYGGGYGYGGYGGYGYGGYGYGGSGSGGWRN
ncbi:ricin-type beta-trefoil lectin domain protein, partial [Streptomyces sp. NPDC000658]|uniref:RICIN domain-containing protein n=1 Tax=Streptomyces sp. NPDC000658 TaxID=3154266 RepID=UPI003318FE10